MTRPLLSAESKVAQAGADTDLLTKVREQTRQTIAELDRAIPPLDAFRAEISAKPKQTLSPLVERLKAKGYSDAEAADAIGYAADRLRCSQCDAITHIPCNCGALYVRAGWRFFAEHPELLKQVNDKGANGHDVTEAPADVTKVSSETKSEELRPMTSAERVRKHRAKVAAESQNGGGGLINELFPKGSPACDIDWEAVEPGHEDDTEQHLNAVAWQLPETERLLVETALKRPGMTGKHYRKAHEDLLLSIERKANALRLYVHEQRRAWRRR